MAGRRTTVGRSLGSRGVIAANLELHGYLTTELCRDILARTEFILAKMQLYFEIYDTKIRADKWRQATVRVWHDTLRSLRELMPQTDDQRVMKEEGIRSWLKYGAVFDLKEGVDETTQQVPSVPSDIKPYWKIPRRCFWEACGCAAGSQLPAHRLRVCRGCWRVLYCSSKCQSL